MPDGHLEAVTPRDLYQILTIDHKTNRRFRCIENQVFKCWAQGPITIRKPAKMRS